MTKGKIAWLVRGSYGEALEDEDNWEILFEEPRQYRYKDIKKVVWFEIE